LVDAANEHVASRELASDGGIAYISARYYGNFGGHSGFPNSPFQTLTLVCGRLHIALCEVKDAVEIRFISIVKIKDDHLSDARPHQQFNHD
jgi:hypothetical protein